MAQPLKSPGVVRKEIDLSEIVATVGTSIGATVGYAREGIVNGRTLLTSDKEYVTKFGKPKAHNSFLTGYAVQEFLKESDSCYFTRCTDGSEKYANAMFSETATGSQDISATSSTVLVAAVDLNEPDAIYDLDTNTTTSGSTLRISSIGPGIYGNNLAITISTSATSTVSADLANNYVGSKDDDGTDMASSVIRIDVFQKDQEDSDFSDVSGSPVETWEVTTKEATGPNGAQLFAEDVINGNSNYIYVNVNSTMKAGGLIPYADSLVQLTGGYDGAADYSLTQAAQAWTVYTDTEQVTVNILMAPYAYDSNTTLIQTVGNLAASRLDCIAVIQVDDTTDLTTAAIITNADALSLNGASYVAKYAGWDKYYDSYSDKIIQIPRCIAGAVIMARTDRIANTWDAPAGTNRGVIGYSIGQNKVWNKTDIGNLYVKNINTAKKIAGSGIVLWGQKTAQKKKSALDRINVRRMLLYVENSVEPTLESFLFENNDVKTRLRVYNIIDAFMRTVQSGGGVTKYEVVCDDSNNTATVIDNNELIVDIYVQPPKTIEFIRLNVIVTKTSATMTRV